MKGAKNTRQQYGNSERKSGKRSEKAAKLDRKSSRGMIYENEELRLRTININAEVERGQSDIKRLRRENEHLRREIWTLRDECDRLNKRFKAKILEHDHGGCNARGSGGSGGGCPRGCDGLHSHSNSDDSDSCDTCRCDDDRCSDDCCREGSCNQLPSKQPIVDEMSRASISQNQQNSSGIANAAVSASGATFDHLSVVSEETMSNSEVLAAPQQDHLLGFVPDTVYSSQTTLPSLVGPLTPLTPIEMVANQLNDLQAMVPPLSYFENILAQHMGSNIGTTPESSTTTSTSGATVQHTNGWDYNLQSPFAQRKCSASSTTTPSTVPGSSPLPQRYAAQQTLTTFMSNTLTPPTIVNTNECGEIVSTPQIQYGAPSNIETVAITTMPANMPQTLNSPKHFFAPLKPRLKINTSLANKQLVPAEPPVIPTTTTTTHQNCNPPDIYVTNGLASPYQRPVMPANTSITVNQPTPPPLPQRIKSPQVSPCHRQRHHHVYHQHQHQHQQQKQLKQPTAVVAVSVVDVAAVVDLTAGIPTTPINTNCLQMQQVIPLQQQQQPLHQHHHQQQQQISSSVHIEKSNTLLSKINEPIYATAQKSCNILISATALTKPLMTATTNTTKSTTASTNLSKTTTVTTILPSTKDGIVQVKTDSANLESILNDIETISEDILAIQLDKNRSHENITMTMTSAQSSQSIGNSNSPLKQDDKSKKPYRSEMNLLLTYDGTNSTITPALTAVSAVQTGRTRSLEREHTDSPSPNVPDPMAPFPENRTYIGFDQLNAAACGGTTAMNVQLQKPPLPPSQLVVGTVGSSSISKPVKPPKPTPPTPPSRMYPPPLNIRCAGVARATPMSTPNQSNNEQTSLIPGSPVHGLEPNKSHLFAAIAQAAAKRAQYRAVPPELSHSLDAEIRLGGDNDEANDRKSPLGEAVTDEALQTTDAARRKARRVSIVCGDTNSPTTPEHTSVQQLQLRSPAQTNNPCIPTSDNNCATTLANPAATASCSDIASALATHALRNLKQISHSTPNSPHSMRRRSNSNTLPDSPLAANTVGGPPHQQTHGALQPHHHHTQSSSNVLANALQRMNSQESARGHSGELSNSAAIIARSKCSRRHSDGTVASNLQRISGASGGGSSGGTHHHHHHHQSSQHQHSSLLLSNNPHHSHHSHQDSNQETGTSLSDRNSNSLASSRESSTSFSMRSQRRKISVSSHTGGKIPWCGCWGNGCL